MANKNFKWFAEFSAKYGINYQIVKGNNTTIHVAIINGRVHNKLAQLSKQQTEKLFKDISMGVAVKNKTVTVCSDTIYLNGTKYNIIDTIKGIKVNRLIKILDDNKGNNVYYGIGAWLLDRSNRKEYLNTLTYEIGKPRFFNDFVRLGYYLDMGKMPKSDKEISGYANAELAKWIPLGV